MPRRGTLLAVLLALAPLAGCLGPAQGGPSGAVPFETISQGADSGVEEREETVVRTSEEWEQLWQRHAPDEDRPAIDLEERMVVAIFKGESPDGCHGAVIENVTGDGSQLTVEGAYVEATGAYCTQQITHPFHIVALDQHDVPVAFNVTEETRDRGGDGQDDDGNDDRDDDQDDDQDDGGSGDGGSYACRTEGSGEASSGEAATVGFETIDEGSQSQVRERCLTVAWNETAWRDLWRDHHGGSTADEQRPEVDFSQSVVAAVFKGQSPDACHGAEIDNVTRDGDDAVVHGTFYVVQGGACAEVVTYPFHVVELDRPDGEVRFDVREETRQQGTAG